MRKIILIFMISLSAVAQDERFYQDLLNNTYSKNTEKLGIYKIRVETEKYMLDLNRDSVLESFHLEKRDGIDAIVLNNSFGQKVYEALLVPKGKNSRVFRASFKKIDSTTDVLILHYYEGENQSTTFESSGRLYFLTISNRELKNATLFKGPHFWSEVEKTNDKYWRRRYRLSVVDYNKDGTREISVSDDRATRVYKFDNKKGWSRL